MITVDELIARLREFRGDLPVLVEGYEDGWDSISECRLADVVTAAQTETWEGEYLESGAGGRWAYGSPPAETLPAGQALLLVGRRGARRGQ